MNKKSLQISLLPGVSANRLGEISLLLDKQPRNFMDFAPWSEFPDKPKVSFHIAHNRDHIFIKYDVEENEVLARYKEINDPVYKDSCVEFFIGFNDEENYYNIEFNRLGTCLGRYGSKRDVRTDLPVNLLKTIKYERTLVRKTITTDLAINWTLTIALPVQVFCHHNFNSIQHKKAKMNFFKCGDDLSQPHYLAWNNIISEIPNFHLPNFFGEVEFL